MLVEMNLKKYINTYRSKMYRLCIGVSFQTDDYYRSLSFSKKLAIFKHYFQCVMIHIL